MLSAALTAAVFSAGAVAGAVATFILCWTSVYDRGFADGQTYEQHRRRDRNHHIGTYKHTDTD